MKYSGTDSLVASISVMVQKTGIKLLVMFHFLIWIMTISVLGFCEFIKSYIHDFSTFLDVFHTAMYNEVEELILQ